MNKDSIHTLSEISETTYGHCGLALKVVVFNRWQDSESTGYEVRNFTTLKVEHIG